MSKCTQYFIDNNAKMDTYNINNSLFSKKKKMSAKIFSHCDKAWPLYFLTQKEGKDFLPF